MKITRKLCTIVLGCIVGWLVVTLGMAILVVAFRMARMVVSLLTDSLVA